MIPLWLCSWEGNVFKNALEKKQAVFQNFPEDGHQNMMVGSKCLRARNLSFVLTICGTLRLPNFALGRKLEGYLR